MNIPILRLGKCLLVSIQGEVSDSALLDLREELARRIGACRSRGVVLDVSALTTLDSFSARMLHEIASITRFRGAETVIAGIQPEVAYAMAQLGLDLRNVHTVLDLEEGLSYLGSWFMESLQDHGRENGA